MKKKKIDPAAVYPANQLTALRLQYSEEQVQLFAETFAGWVDEDDPFENISTRWAYEWPGEDDEDDDGGHVMITRQPLTAASLRNFALYSGLLDQNLAEKHDPLVLCVLPAAGVVCRDSISDDAFTISKSSNLDDVLDEVKRLGLHSLLGFDLLLCLGAVSYLRKTAQA